MNDEREGMIDTGTNLGDSMRWHALVTNTWDRSSEPTTISSATNFRRSQRRLERLQLGL